MEPETIVLLRFDYVLSESTEQVLSGLTDWFGEDPNTRLGTVGIRGKERVDQTFQLDNPDKVGLVDFDLYAVRLVETSDAITEIISVATVKDTEVSEIVDQHSPSARLPHYRSWRRDMEIIRTKIPENTMGPETTMIWVKPDNIPNVLEEPSPDIPSVEQEFRDGVPAKFLQSFNTSVSRGMTKFGRDSLIFPTEPESIFGDLVAIDFGGTLDRPRNQYGHILAGNFAYLSTLYGVHYWCAARGKDLDEIEDQIKTARDEFPSPSDSMEKVDEYLDLDSEIYDVQKQWGPLHSDIASERSQLEKKLENWDAEFEEGGEDILKPYISGLDDELENVGFDLERVDKTIDSVSKYLNNQISIISTKKAIGLQNEIRAQTKSANDLQKEVNSQMESTNELQDTVKSLTWVLAGLTVLLVFDALMTGGISAFADRVLSEGIDGVTNQVWIGLVLFLLVPIAYWREDILP